VPPAYTGVSPIDALVVLLQHAGGAFAFQLPTISDAFTGGDQAYDGPFYKTRSPLSVVDEVEVPTFVVGGEYDLFQRGEPMLFERLQANGVPSRFVLGPWTHLDATSTPGLEDAGIGTLDELTLRWFDRYLRGRPDASLDRDVHPVTYYEIGSGTWRTAPRWMPGSVHAETFQLDGVATPGTPGALVTGEVTSTGADDVQQVPVAGLCTRSASQWTAGALAVPGCDDNRLNDSTGTSYETAPLSDDLHLLGPINVRLFTSATREDGLLSVHVEDVAPDGHVERLTGGWQTLSHRALDRERSRRLDGEIVQPYHPFTRAAQKPAVPGEVMRVDVEVFPTGAVLQEGHRLRITVQQLDVPHLLPTLPQLFDSTGNVVTIHHSPQLRSRVILPVRVG
jgi:putative CocE/NonD family hydrolase